MNGLLLLPDWEGTTQHELADWLMSHNTFDPPPAGQGLNVSLASAAVHARQLGLTDTSALTELLTYLSVSAGRDPDAAKTEAARAAVRSATGFTGTTPKAPRHDPLIIKANAKALLKGLPPWTSPQPIPDSPHGQLAAVLDWYDPSDLISVQTSTTAGKLHTVAELLVDGPPAPGPKGVYWRANPVKQASGHNHTCTDDDVTKHEWLLIESDCLPLDQQIPLLLSTGLRPAYIVDSGKKSMQAAVRVDASSKEEFATLAAHVLHNLAAIGFDPVTTNTSRLRRMPGAVRPDGRDGEHTLQRLVYLDPAAPTLTPEAAAVVVAKLRKKLRPIDIIAIDDIVYDPTKAAPQIVEGILSANSLGVLYGAPGCGKSFIAMDVSVHVATGGVWRDPIDPRRTFKGPVLYIALEGKDGALKRVSALRGRYKVPPGTPWFLSTSRMNLQAETCVKEIMERVAEVKRRTGSLPVLIVIDTLARAIGGNENDFEAMSRALDHLGQVQDATLACVWLAHHVGKDATRGARGHSSLLGAADSMVEVTKDDEGIITAKIVKQKDDGPCADLVFRLQQIEIGPGQYEDKPATTCLLEHLPASAGGGNDGKNASKRDMDAQRYAEWLDLLPQPSQRAWATAAGFRSDTTMREVIRKMELRGGIRHRKGLGNSIELEPNPIENLPEV